jgi:DNA-binding transcriptional ArsR family regulator
VGLQADLPTELAPGANDAELAPEPNDAELALAVETFKLLGDVTRLRILWALLHGEHSVTELASHVGAQVPAVSQQLAKLRAARLVRVRRQGTRLFYAAEDDHVLGLMEQAIFHTGHPREAGGTEVGARRR